MKITIGKSITIENPVKSIVNYAKDELCIPNPEYTKKARMGFWTGNTPTHINLYEKNGNSIILPYGCLSHLFDMFHEEINEFVGGFGGEEQRCSYDYRHHYIKLYGYQELAVQKMYDEKFGILVAPAGSGKTQMAIELIKREGKKALWITHTLDLLKQSRDRAMQFIKPETIGTIAEGSVEIGSTVTFSTIQTLSKIDLNKYETTWDTIVVDECHRVCGSPTNVTMFYKVLSSLGARHKYGITATPHRADGMEKAMYALLGDIKYEVPQDAVSDRVQTVHIRTVDTGVLLSDKCLSTDGTIQYGKYINYLCENEYRNNLIIEQMIEDKDHPALILSDRLAHLKTLIGMLPESMKDKAVMVSGKMTSNKGKAERDKAVADMRSGEKQYLFATYALAKEGLDIPRLERLYMATPQKDFAVITQAIGRIARVHPHKATPIAYDFVDNNRYAVKVFKIRCNIYHKNRCIIE